MQRAAIAVEEARSRREQESRMSGSETATRVNGSVRFMDRLFEKIEPESRKNSFFSPFSLLAALGMCAEGAKGVTKKAMLEMFGISEQEAEEFRDELITDIAKANEEDKPYELACANALWAQKDLEFVPNFSEQIENDFGGNFVEVDYKDEPEAAVSQINEWCDEKTHHKIKEIIDRSFINKDTLLVLTNAIYFKGKWDKQFPKANTKDENFTLEDGKKEIVKMMNLESRFRYAESDDFQAIELPYKGDDLSMVVILPVSESGANPTELYQQAVEELHSELVNVKLPRFTMETKYKLSKILVELGGGIAFSDSADFSGISEKESMKISEVIHKAFVQCDEEGTEAAAVTAVGMIRCTSAMPKRPKQFVADKPFWFFIRNTETNNVLFCGKVANPSAAS